VVLEEAPDEVAHATGLSGIQPDPVELREGSLQKAACHAQGVEWLVVDARA